MKDQDPKKPKKPLSKPAKLPKGAKPVKAAKAPKKGLKTPENSPVAGEIPLPAASTSVPAGAAASASPNHAKNKAPKTNEEVSYERARKRLIERYAYKEDELDVTFKTEEALIAFYHECVVKGLNTVDAAIEKEIGMDEDDTFDLTPDEKRQLLATTTAGFVDKAREIDQSQFAPSARVAPEEMAETLRSLEDLKNEEI